VTAQSTPRLMVDALRAEFPVLQRETRPGVPLVYLDSAATSQKPRVVINAMSSFYERQNANIHRGVHQLAEEATQAYEDSRRRIARFINAPSARQVVFTRNTTESINLVAFAWGRTFLRPGDVIVLTEMEHHSNLVPWQMLAAERGVTLEFIPVNEDGRLDLATFRELLNKRPALVAVTQLSNVLGTINPMAEIVLPAQQAGAVVLVDAAQSVPHLPVDVQALGADFVAFSGHKMCGPTGIGVLYGREELLQAMPPFLGGGDMIKRVRLREFTANELPYKFEAGTPPIAEVIGLGAAVEFLQGLGMAAIWRHEQALAAYALERLEEVPGLRHLGPHGPDKAGVLAFSFADVHPHDVAQILDRDGIAVRAGHHCAMPLHEKFGLPATTRASLYLYNDERDIDKLVDGLYKVKAVFN
jgi:cysteine desulfurase / selenocysteine lyase